MTLQKLYDSINYVIYYNGSARLDNEDETTILVAGQYIETKSIDDYRFIGWMSSHSAYGELFTSTIDKLTVKSLANLNTSGIQNVEINAEYWPNEIITINAITRYDGIEQNTNQPEVFEYYYSGENVPTGDGILKVGDTITDAEDPTITALPGYKPMKPMVYCGIYPIESNKYGNLKEAIEKLKLNDASLTFEPETSSTLGFGFRMGFLGLLHLEIISERIEREFGLDIIATTPSVNYEINLTDNTTIFIDNPSLMPDKVRIKEIREPYIFTNILVPTGYIGPIMELCQDKRGIYKSIDYLDKTRVNIMGGMFIKKLTRIPQPLQVGDELCRVLP